MTNTPSGEPCDTSLDDRIMAKLPSRIRNWILYEAPWDVNVRDVAKVFVHHARQTTEQAATDNILRGLRTEQRTDCRNVYGSSHPQASLF